MTGITEIAKKTIRIGALIVVSPLVVLYWLLRPVSREDSLFAGFSQTVSLFPGLLGSYLRIAFYRCAMSHCANDSYIGFGTLFSHRDTELHSGIYIGPQCNIGLSVIHRNCLLGSGVHLLSGKNQHRFDDPDTPVRLQGGEFTKISLGENTWVGNGAIIMANVGRDCIIGAGTVVTNDIPPGSIVAGNPGKVVRSRYAESTKGATT
ncbi:transferase hexapeptide (six repeat-containing protein) [Marinobacter sp. DSM 26671]|uniref:acyltransferase n=1 Tax=Marinobacter sp. DSM 26671 TaxID=1761793 RepID=UPI0008F2161D|nr:acyltransferase [Marinobacter sp. DSM 26671]SFD90963.1 transferase hexapeptide (six repeat-containing protein) [Marinobacter sp. DSM 26671]